MKKTRAVLALSVALLCWAGSAAAQSFNDGLQKTAEQSVLVADLEHLLADVTSAEGSVFGSGLSFSVLASEAATYLRYAEDLLPGRADGIVADVPEPSSYVLLLSGAAMLGWLGLLRTKKQCARRL